jgi:ribosomal protection tetracycline resistance protein
MSSTAGDLRDLTALVLTDGLEQAGTRVPEPMRGSRCRVSGGPASPW